MIKSKAKPLMGSDGARISTEPILRNRQSFWPWLVFVLAAAMLLVVAIPGHIWNRGANNAVYSGFDSNLVYVNQNNPETPGIVLVSRDKIRMTSIPGSQPAVHLLTSPSDFEVALDVQVQENAGGGAPLRIQIWNPRKESAFSVIFGPPPEDAVTTETRFQGTVKASQVLGTYSPGSSYHLQIKLDHESGNLAARIVETDRATPTHFAALLVGGPSEPGYRELNSEYAPVSPNRAYSFGGSIRLISGRDNYKVLVDWFDRNKKRLGYSGGWVPVAELNGWTKKVIDGVAPSRAAFAQVVLGAGNGRTQLLMTDLFLRPSGSQTNLIPNGDFTLGSVGWKVAGATDPTESPRLVPPSSSLLETHLGQADLPHLFDGLPIAVTATTGPGGGITTATLQRYSLTLPSNTYTGVHVVDWKAFLVLALLAAGGMLAVGLAIAVAIRRRAKTLKTWSQFLATPLTIRAPLVGLGLAAACLLYLIGNALLFRLGSHTFDMTSEKIFAYVAANYHLADLYYLPSTVTPAKVWAGVPYAQASFAYGPTLGWIFGGVGWIYRLFLADPAGGRMDSFQLEVLIKTMGVLFGLADGLLIFSILRRTTVSRRWALIGFGLFLFNPAVWFLASVWGQTQTISLFFLLLAVWFALKDMPTSAWIILAVASLTRPQAIFPAVLLALYLLKKFSIRRNLEGFSWGVICAFLVCAPFLLRISPTFPVDYIAGTISNQNPSSPDVASFNFVSYDGINLWPLLTHTLDGQTGKGSLYYPVSSPVVGGITFSFLATAAFLAVFFVITIGLALLRVRGRPPGIALPFVAAGTLSFLMLLTGVSATHFILGLAFVILIRSSVSTPTYLIMIGLLSITMFVSMFGSLGFALSQVGYLAPALNPATSSVTRLFMSIFDSNYFVTAAVAANLFVMVSTIGIAARVLLRSRTLGSGSLI